MKINHSLHKYFHQKFNKQICTLAILNFLKKFSSDFKCFIFCIKISYYTYLHVSKREIKLKILITTIVI